MKKMALMKAMSSTESSTMSPSDGGLYKVKQKIKSNQNQRKIKRVMKDQQSANTSSNRPSSSSSSAEDEVKAYAQPIKYKVQQFKKNVKQKMEDVVIEAKKKKMERKNKREGAGGEGGFSVCGPGGCKEGNYSQGRDKAASKPAWMGKN
jgi:hypothetical protein